MKALKALLMHGKDGVAIAPVKTSDFRQVGTGKPIAARGGLCYIQTNNGDAVAMNTTLIQNRT